jgi:hypothetical protein
MLAARHRGQSTFFQQALRRDIEVGRYQYRVVDPQEPSFWP